MFYIWINSAMYAILTKYQKKSSYDIMIKSRKIGTNSKIVTVEYLELIDQNKIRLILTLPQKCENFLDMHIVIQLLIFFA